MQDLFSKTSNLLSKVPEITIFFRIIKMLSTTVGETGADFLIFNMHIGLSMTSIIMSCILLAMLILQISLKKYRATSYRITVVLISIVGTLISDQMVDNRGISLVTTTISFSSALCLVFIAWYCSEKTLSIHSIFSKKRELFYWGAILCTFALGTAGGDLLAEGLGLGYLTSAFIFFGIIVLINTIGRSFNLNTILTFWMTYILTRPLGASLGDRISQPIHNGGLGLGSVWTSALFLITISGLIIYLEKKDAT